MVYIELNPVKAGIVKLPENYPWSSYKYYALGEENDLLAEDIFYQELGSDQLSRQQAYQELVIDKTIPEMVDKSNTIVAIGSKNFVYNTNRRAKYHENNKDASYRKRSS